MNDMTINIIIVGIIIFGLAAMFLNQIELASVALGGIVGFLSKQNITIETLDKKEEVICDESEC